MVAVNDTSDINEHKTTPATSSNCNCGSNVIAGEASVGDAASRETRGRWRHESDARCRRGRHTRVRAT